MNTTGRPLVGILMGSDSDWPTMKAAADVLAEFNVVCEVNVMSAHRTPDDVAEYARTAATRGLQVIITGAGGAAHLGGVVAAVTPLPVIGVPIETKCAGGLDSLLSIVQMPSGVPVAAVAIGGAKNAGILAAQIIATGDAALRGRLVKFKAKIAAEARANNQKLRESLP